MKYEIELRTLLQFSFYFDLIFNEFKYFFGKIDLQR